MSHVYVMRKKGKNQTMRSLKKQSFWTLHFQLNSSQYKIFLQIQGFKDSMQFYQLGREVSREFPTRLNGQESMYARY